MSARERTDTLVVGAGPAGLAAAACLKRAGVPVIVVERADAVGATWRRHYDRLHLHTIKEMSSLPGLPFSPEVPRYPSRDQVVDYLERYAATHGLSPRFGHEVQRIAETERGWEVDTTQGAFLAERIVIASGYNRRPRQPTWPGEDAFEGEILHSSRYRNGAPYRGKRVLVVGSGNSGAEIALCLWEHGATVSLCIRGPVHVIERDSFGIPAQRLSVSLSWLPNRLVDRIATRLMDVTIGDLSPFGIVRPDVGIGEMIRTRGRIPLVDIGTIGLIKQGAITVVPGIERFAEAGVRCVDGREVLCDVVVLATGYDAALSDFLEGAEHFVDEQGYPRRHLTEAELAGLYFIGYTNPQTGALREIAIEARRIADAIGEARGRGESSGERA